MKGYKIPEGWAIGWRNAIERYPKDSEYAWGMNAVLESIEAFPLEELDENPWHTGTPTEEGEYICWTIFPKDICRDPEGSWKCEWKNGKWFDGQINDNISMDSMGVKIIAWQKIEPYKEKKCKHCLGCKKNEIGEDVSYCEIWDLWRNVTLGDCFGNCEDEEA